MTYAERELVPLGFRVIESGLRRVVLGIGHLKLQFDCSCPPYARIKALGCPLHHEGPGGSWPVENAKTVGRLFKEYHIPPVQRPASPPENCGLVNEDLECLGCGIKMGTVRPGKCYAVEGETALKTNTSKEVANG